MYTKRDDFTLIELLLFISFVVLIASLVILAYKDVRNKTAYVVAEIEMNHIINSLTAINESQKALINITGNNCSECSCRRPFLLEKVNESSLCFNNWKTVLSKIDTLSMSFSNSNSDGGLMKDPWGSPYLLDENELEFPNNPCRYDRLSTAGSDRIMGNSDDFVMIIPFRTQICR